MNNDTIFALSSAHGKSGVAVIRISGDNLRDTFGDFLGRDNFDARHAYFANLRDTSGDLIDQALLLYFAAPNSFTGTDIIEIQTHGAPAVITAVFDLLTARGMRMATRGEFSRRAFYNGKMNLADIDGLAALLDAQTDAQRKSALHSMTGGDAEIYNTWRGQMIEIAAYAAAMLDYADDDLPHNIGDKIRTRTEKLHRDITTALSHYTANRAVRNGFNIVLVGNTNVGKSSIFNKIAGTNRAIVSDIAGTTRDVVSSTLDIDGYLVNLMDTAGLRDVTDDKIEQIGIERTKSEIQNADLIIRVYGTNTAHSAISDNEILVINKSDKLRTRPNKNAIYTSTKTGDGIDELMNAIRDKMHKIMSVTESALVVNERTHGLLIDAARELDGALTVTNENYDLFSEHVRRASDCIGKILGTITTADVMDATFSALCLGK